MRLVYRDGLRMAKKELTLFQRWGLHRAWKLGVKASATVSESDGYLFIMPPVTDLIGPYMEPLRQWLKQTERGNVRILLPKSAKDLLNLLDRNVFAVTFSDFDLKRNKMPTPAFRDRILNTPSDTVVLLARDVYPLTETAFALAPAKRKAAHFHALRENRAQIIVHTKEDAERAERCRTLLTTLSTFVHPSVRVSQP